MSRIFGLLVAVCLVAAQIRSARSADPPTVERVFLGYYASFVDFPAEQIPWKELTHLSHAFVPTNNEGKLAPNEKAPSKSVTEAGHAHGVKVLLCLGSGQTTLGLRRITPDPQATGVFAKEVADMVAEHGYDGVDLDWEFPSNRAERSGFVTLIGALRGALDERAKSDQRSEPYLLTVVVAPSGFFGKWIDTGAILGYVDWIHVMAYDMADPWSREAAHHAPLLPSENDPERSWRSVTSAMEYWRNERGVPTEKLVLGMPLYGRLMPVEKPYAQLDESRRSEHRTLGFTEIQQLVSKNWPASWDNEAKAPWLSSPKNEKQSKIIAFDDRNSIDLKTKWARSQKFRGVYFWAIHQDRMPDDTHWLIRAANKAWPKK